MSLEVPGALPEHRRTGRDLVRHVRVRVRAPMSAAQPAPGLHLLLGLCALPTSQAVPHSGLSRDPDLLPRLREGERVPHRPHMGLSSAERRRLHLLRASSRSEDPEASDPEGVVRRDAEEVRGARHSVRSDRHPLGVPAGSIQ